MPASRAGKAKTFSQILGRGIVDRPAAVGVRSARAGGRRDRGGPDRRQRARVPLHGAPPHGDGVRAEIVAVGTELLLGQIANTNARWMSESLAAIGVDVLHHQAVGDNLERIVEAIRLASSRADVVIVTGGLGPTQDDITRDALGVLVGGADGAPSGARGDAQGEVPRPSAGARCPRATSARPTCPRVRGTSGPIVGPRPDWPRSCPTARGSTRCRAFRKRWSR